MATNTTKSNEIENMIELESDSEIVSVIQEEKLSPRIYEKGSFWLILIVIILVILSTIIGFVVAFNMSSVGPSGNKDTAQQQIGFILEQIALNESNVTDYINELHDTFAVFDANNDNVWNNEELSDYLQSISSSDDVFHIMDINGDNILSYREIIAIFMELDKISVISGHIKGQFGFVVEEIYNHSYIEDDNNDNILWFQYVADLFLNFYDSSYNGYISYDAYYDVYANKYFDSFDLDNDNVIDFAEFISDTFNEETIVELTSFGLENIGGLQTDFVEIISTLNESTVNAIPLKTWDDSKSMRRMIGGQCGGGDCEQQAKCISTAVACAANVVLGALCVGFSAGFAAPGCIAPAIAVCAEAVIECALYAESVTIDTIDECIGKDHCVCVGNTQTYSLKFTLTCGDGTIIGTQSDITNGLQKCIGYNGECSGEDGHPVVYMGYYDAWFLWTIFDCDNDKRTDNGYIVNSIPSHRGVSLQVGIHPDGAVDNICSASQGILINDNLYITELGKDY